MNVSIFYINSVKIQMAWFFEKRELHSFVDGRSIVSYRDRYMLANAILGVDGF
jgi:hypothetical protein